MIDYTLAERVQGRRPAVGCWMTLSDPDIPLLFAAAGFHWVFVDSEHNPFDEQLLRATVQAASGAGISPVIRVRSNQPDLIKAALDFGAAGVVVPQLFGAADFRRAVENAKYPPLGTRGYGPLRATGFWSTKDEYDRRANQDLILIGQVETAEAVEAIEEIVTIPGLDALFIGPADLSHSLGHPGRVDHPAVQEAITRVIEVSNRAGVPWGIPIIDQAGLRKRLAEGALLPTWASDNYFIRVGAAAAQEQIAIELGDGNRKEE